MQKIELFYPGFTKKAVTFTIDDGNMTQDAKLIDILRPAGIKGTFNLCSEKHKGIEDETRSFYQGYGVANHCKFHPLVNLDSDDIAVSDEIFDEKSSDPSFLYKVDGRDGFFWQMQRNGWRQMVFEDDYIKYVLQGLDELRDIFGNDTVVDYVWPYRQMENARVSEFVKDTHRSVRKTGCTRDLDGFAIPKDKKAWSYTADHTNLLEVMEMYDKYPDDGELKFFAFGVHSMDFERDNRWDDLRTFAAKYGSRSDRYWYATVGEIFDYEESLALLKIGEDYIENSGKTDIYLKAEGKKTVIRAGEILKI